MEEVYGTAAAVETDDLNDFFSALLDDANNDELLGDAMDVSTLLAHKLTLEEEREYAEWVRRNAEAEERDRRFAEQLLAAEGAPPPLADADLAFALSLEQQQQQPAVPTRPSVDADLAFAMSLEQELHTGAGAGARAASDADLAFAMALEQELQKAPAVDVKGDLSLALALQLQEEEERENAQRAERFAREERDAELARHMEADWNKPAPVMMPPPPVHFVARPPVAIPVDDRPLSESFEGLMSTDFSPYVDLNLNALRHYIRYVCVCVCERRCVRVCVCPTQWRDRSLGAGVTIRPVLRTALSERWLECKQQYERKYGADSAESKATICCKRAPVSMHCRSRLISRTTVHGTKLKHIGAIEQGGLKVPGLGTGVKHENDNGWWGKGIYVSPVPSYAAGYAESGKLIVCAVLRGRVFVCDARMDGQGCVAGYDSHEAEAGQECVLWWRGVCAISPYSKRGARRFVLFKGAQVIPLMVIEMNPQKRARSLLQLQSADANPSSAAVPKKWWQRRA